MDYRLAALQPDYPTVPGYKLNGLFDTVISWAKGLGEDWAAFPRNVKNRLRNVSPDGSFFDYMTSSRGFIEDALMGVAMPPERLKEFAQNLRQSQDTVDFLWQRIQLFKANPQAAIAAGVNIADLEKAQQNLYVSYTYMNFWAQVVPYTHEAVKAAGVRPADYVSAVSNSVLIRAFAYWFNIDKDFETYKKNQQLFGLSALGEPITLSVAVTVAVAAICIAWIGYMAIRQVAISYRDTTDKIAQKNLVACVAKGGPEAAQCKVTLDTMIGAAQKREKQADEGAGLGDLTKLFIGAGALIAVVALFPLITEAGKSGAQALKSRREAVAGLHARRRRPRRR